MLFSFFLFYPPEPKRRWFFLPLLPCFVLRRASEKGSASSFAVALLRRRTEATQRREERSSHPELSRRMTGRGHFTTFTLIPSLLLANSGAYMHCILVIPLLKSPLCWTVNGYSNTYVPFGSFAKKKLVAASRVLS